MVKHIVLFKLIDPKNEIKIEAKRRLLELKKHIEVIRSIEVGINFCEEDRAYDLVLVTEFISRKDLNIYAQHNYHLEVVEYIKSITQSSKVVDFEN
jgi:hypothetical protein